MNSTKVVKKPTRTVLKLEKISKKITTDHSAAIDSIRRTDMFYQCRSNDQQFLRLVVTVSFFRAVFFCCGGSV